MSTLPDSIAAFSADLRNFAAHTTEGISSLRRTVNCKPCIGRALPLSFAIPCREYKDISTLSVHFHLPLAGCPFTSKCHLHEHLYCMFQSSLTTCLLQPRCSGRAAKNWSSKPLRSPLRLRSCKARPWMLCPWRYICIDHSHDHLLHCIARCSLSI